LRYPADGQPRDLGRQRRYLSRRRAVVIDLGSQPAGLRGVCKEDALADGGGERRRIMVGQRLGRLAGIDGATLDPTKHHRAAFTNLTRHN
jgi:hypothetical protein